METRGRAATWHRPVCGSGVHPRKLAHPIGTSEAFFFGIALSMCQGRGGVEVAGSPDGRHPAEGALNGDRINTTNMQQCAWLRNRSSASIFGRSSLDGNARREKWTRPAVSDQEGSERGGEADGQENSRRRPFGRRGKVFDWSPRRSSNTPCRSSSTLCAPSRAGGGLGHGGQVEGEGQTGGPNPHGSAWTNRPQVQSWHPRRRPTTSAFVPKPKRSLCRNPWRRRWNSDPHGAGQAGDRPYAGVMGWPSEDEEMILAGELQGTRKILSLWMMSPSLDKPSSSLKPRRSMKQIGGKFLLEPDKHKNSFRSTIRRKWTGS